MEPKPTYFEVTRVTIDRERLDSWPVTNWLDLGEILLPFFVDVLLRMRFYLNDARGFLVNSP